MTTASDRRAVLALIKRIGQLYRDAVGDWSPNVGDYEKNGVPLPELSADAWATLESQMLTIGGYAEVIETKAQAHRLKLAAGE